MKDLKHEEAYNDFLNALMNYNDVQYGEEGKRQIEAITKDIDIDSMTYINVDEFQKSLHVALESNNRMFGDNMIEPTLKQYVEGYDNDLDASHATLRDLYARCEALANTTFIDENAPNNILIAHYASELAQDDPQLASQFQKFEQALRAENPPAATVLEEDAAKLAHTYLNELNINISDEVRQQVFNEARARDATVEKLKDDSIDFG